MIENITITQEDGVEISSILQTSSNNDKVVIICHGRASSKESKTCINLERVFSEAGIDTIRFDFYGHGESSGILEETTISKGISNLKTVHNFLKEKGYSSFGLVGVSFGGEISILTAAKLDKLKVLALKAPALDYVEKENIEWGLEGIEKWKQDGYVLKDGKKLNYSFYEDALRFDFKKEASQISVPTLIIAAENDEKIPIHQTKAFHEVIKGSELYIMKGATHTFPNKEQHDQANEMMFSFISSQL